MSKESTPLSLIPSSYRPEDGVVVRAETMSFDPDIHDIPGVYLQIVDGCGYTVYEMTPEEAETVAKMLIASAAETRKNFGVKKA